MKTIVVMLVAAFAMLQSVSAPAADDKSPPPAGQPELMPGAGGPPVADTSGIKTKFIDVQYANLSATQKLDIFLPNEGKGPFPLIIEIHGGGFMMGQKSGAISPMLEGLKRNYAVASINYRLSKEAQFPAAVNDVKAAIKFLRANAGKYNLDPNKFASWGGSAGGNLSAMAAVSGDVKSLIDPALGNAEVSDKVQAAIDWFGPIYFSTMDAEFAALGSSGKMGPTNAMSSAESKYLGKQVGTPEAQPLVEAASPMTYITKDDPPMYIQHGTADRNIPITQSMNFAQKLGEAIGKEKVVFEKIEGEGHGGSKFDAPENAQKLLDFLDKALKQ